jgi:hypothetical protein
MRFRTCCLIIIPVVLVGACLTSFILYFALTGGYWENRPPLDRLSGPLRFMQYVCAPLPGAVNQARGGYSGFTDGFIGTSFALEGEFPVDRCLGDAWIETPVDELEGILWIELSADAVTHAFVYSGDGDPRYLMLDEDNGRGYLYIP